MVDKNTSPEFSLGTRELFELYRHNCKYYIGSLIDDTVDPHYLTEFCHLDYLFLKYQITYASLSYTENAFVLLFQRFSSFVKQKILILLNIL